VREHDDPGGSGDADPGTGTRQRLVAHRGRLPMISTGP
jgi:hypothetical protein